MSESLRAEIEIEVYTDLLLKTSWLPPRVNGFDFIQYMISFSGGGFRLPVSPHAHALWPGKAPGAGAATPWNGTGRRSS